MRGEQVSWGFFALPHRGGSKPAWRSELETAKQRSSSSARARAPSRTQHRRRAAGLPRFPFKAVSPGGWFLGLPFPGAPECAQGERAGGRAARPLT